MSWDDVRMFIALAKAGSLAGAGRELDVRHTTVARRVAQLEQDLGVTLITRTPDGVQLTEAAMRILPHAEAAQAAVEALCRGVSGDDGRIAGPVRVTVSEGFSGFVVRSLPPLKERYPELDIHVLAGNRAFDLARHEADIALRMVPTTDAELRVRKLVDAGWAAYAARGYLEDHPVPRTTADLHEHSLIGFDDAMAKVPGAEWIRAQGLEARVAMRTNSLPAALSAAVAGLGVAVLPCMLGGAERTLVQVHDVIGRRAVWLVTHPDVERTARVRVVIDHFVELVERERDLLEGRDVSTPDCR